ncbi:MAG TPA: ComF family protein [Patescibacteria group bacterium]|nr:ComF family protein [Patescibacteria group bacterium]
MDLLDLLFPKRCVACKAFGSYICPNCFAYLSFQSEDNCLVCNRPAIGGKTHPGCVGRYTIDGVSASLTYNHTAKRMITALKYQPYISNMKTVLAELFYEGIIQKPYFVKFSQQSCLLVPIPLHPSRLRRRGYNQSELLAKEMAKKFGFKVENCLQRIKDTSSQFALKREDRLKNMKDAFVLKLKTKDLIQNKAIILVDDLVTSGATMLETAKVLKKSGAKNVWGVALCHGS